MSCFGIRTVSITRLVRSPRENNFLLFHLLHLTCLIHREHQITIKFSNLGSLNVCTCRLNPRFNFLIWITCHEFSKTTLSRWQQRWYFYFTSRTILFYLFTYILYARTCRIFNACTNIHFSETIWAVFYQNKTRRRRLNSRTTWQTFYYLWNTL